MSLNQPSRPSPLGWGGLDKFEGQARRAALSLWLICLVLGAHATVTGILAFRGEVDSMLWLVYDLLGTWYLLLLVIAAVLFIQWLRSARQNLKAYGRELQFSDASAVYWWLVPLANLVMPYRVVREVVEESRAMTMGDMSPDRSRWWWSLFVGGYLISLFVALVASGETLDTRVLLSLEALAAVVMSAAAFLGLGVVTSVTRIQIGEAGWR